MKNKILLLLTAFIMIACASKHEEALRSADKDFILKSANELFAKKKWTQALELYERLTSLVAGTDEAANVLYNSAYANYYDKNYQLAGHQFKNFSVTFPQDPRREDAAYMSALCYYQGSLPYNLDQTSTVLAIDELQSFINKYPNSEKAKNTSQLIDELTNKLELKAYENAKQYFKMGEYKAADIALQNFLDDYPSTKLRDKVLGYQLESKYELGMKSTYELKEERLEKAIDFSKLVQKTLPNTAYASAAQRMEKDLLHEQKDFLALKKRIEEQRELQKVKQEKEAMHRAEKAKQVTHSALIDSAKIAAPTTQITLPIRK